jgi:4-hydroxy-3-methylbut-2-enyl diphosphate reductase
MRVILAKLQGFCFGVKRAVDLAKDASKKSSVQVLGQLVHNPEVILNLEAQGINSIETLEEATAKTIVITAHGATKETYDRGTPCLDATCPFVSRLQKKAKLLSQDGFQVIIVGDPHHLEVVSVSSFTKNPIVVTSLDEAKAIGFFEKLALLSQTTQDENLLKAVACELTSHTNQLLFENTICTSTRERQKEVAHIASFCQAIVVVGGKQSANTGRLFKIAKEKGTPTFWIEGPLDLTDKLQDEIKGVVGCGSVGLVSGASTPIESVLEVESILSEA